jgi:hypothetical protein
MKLDTTDTIILTVGIIAIITSVIHAVMWLRVLAKICREESEHFYLPPTDLDGRDTRGGFYTHNPKGGDQ